MVYRVFLRNFPEYSLSFTLPSQLWEDHFWQKQIIWKVQHHVVNLEKTLEYLKIQESCWFESFTEYYWFLKEYFDMFFPIPKYIPQAQNDINHWSCKPHDYLFKNFWVEI